MHIRKDFDKEKFDFPYSPSIARDFLVIRLLGSPLVYFEHIYGNLNKSIHNNNKKLGWTTNRERKENTYI
jgi:hypothetical protein